MIARALFLLCLAGLCLPGTALADTPLATTPLLETSSKEAPSPTEARPAVESPAEVKAEPDSVPPAEPSAAEAPPAEAPSAEQLAARIDRFALEAPRFLKDTTRVPLAELRKLGALRQETVKKAANAHDPVKIDTYHTLEFDGLEVYGYLGDQQELWPIRIVVSTDAWEIADDLSVGADSERLLAVLGEPGSHAPEAWLYQGGIQNVNFYLKKNRITKIEFIYYLD